MITTKIARAYNEILKRFLRKSFPLWENMGFHVIPNHYYQPVPDTRTLKDDLWHKQSDLVGIDINEQAQINLLSLFSSKFKREYESFPRSKTSVPYQYYVDNRVFESVDGEIVYCMIRYFKPRMIIEIGSGHSTYLAAQAVQKNQADYSHKCELIAVEPYPNDVLRGGFPGLSKLIPTKVQDISLSEFSKLRENDVLFMDSSHVLKIGSDVQYEFLEILPRLNKGVIVHVHDIFLPAEYPKEWVLKDYRFWTEQYLLQAFLIFNNSFEVLWAGSYMHLKHSDKLEAAFSSYKRDERWPGSFWMRKTK
ncbi:MAG: class I SAM-dependent methyltransferase [Deltaproteobacteria bacterium]|nr:class I SAM-dependent methyltransferase [Deltaproteobacteria bacterium]